MVILSTFTTRFFLDVSKIKNEILIRASVIEVPKLSVVTTFEGVKAQICFGILVGKFVRQHAANVRILARAMGTPLAKD